MPTALVNLTEKNSRKLEELSRSTGKSPDDLLNEAVEHLPTPPCKDWKAAWRQAAGMWKDRDDIPELMAQLKREWNRIDPAE